MEHNIQVGMEHTVEYTVTMELSAEAVGSGSLPVYATPYMIALMEKASEQCVIGGLADGFGTVGTEVDIKHIAATPLGMKVTAHAVLKEINGRQLVFDVRVCDEKEEIGNGSHTRFIIDKAKFMERVNAKL